MTRRRSRLVRRPLPRGAQDAAQRIILDLDATDDPLHGHQEGRFFHGYYDGSGDLPLYVFCGRHLLAAKLRRSNIDASAGALTEIERLVGQIRARWPKVEILLRADSGFARDELMAWGEAHRVAFVFRLARNERLVYAGADELVKVSGKVAYAVMSFGGFLGIGDRYHPLPWDVLTYDTSQGGYVVDRDQSMLEGAPTYGTSETPNWGDPGWHQQVHDYYGARRWWD